MPQLKRIAIDQLALDPENYRTVPQRSEAGAVHALISLKPEWFWALCASLLEDGYRPHEAVIVLEDGKELVVKEGNRRIAALKVVLGQVQLRGVEIPADLKTRIDNLSAGWKAANSSVPCAVYPAEKAELVDRIVDQIHGKGEKAGRLDWPSIARARHNKANGASEPGLDLLEKYLKKGENLSKEQAERWGGDYNVTVLDEVLKRSSERFGGTSARNVVDLYPDKIKHRAALEEIMADIGLSVLTFPKVRDEQEDFGAKYKLPKPPEPPPAGGANGTAGAAGTPANGAANTGQGTAPGQPAAPGTPATTPARKPAATASNDGKNVKRLLRRLRPVGQNREKVVVLLNEARKLDLQDHSHAFCYVLRAMFELSAKAYCDDHAADGLSVMKQNGKEYKELAVVLGDITQYLIAKAGGPKTPQGKQYHGAMTLLGGQSNNPLSVTSMNQLIHNGIFVVDETHIATFFANVYPLLEAMNH